MLAIALLTLFGSSKKENWAQLDLSNGKVSVLKLDWFGNIVVVLVSWGLDFCLAGQWDVICFYLFGHLKIELIFALVGLLVIREQHLGRTYQAVSISCDQVFLSKQILWKFMWIDYLSSTICFYSLYRTNLRYTSLLVYR